MRHFVRAAAYLVATAVCCTTAQAVMITFDNALTITDNLPGFDFNATIGVIDFDSTSSGPLTVSGYEVKGRVTTLVGGNTLTMANATSIVTLTNFVADTGTALPGQNVIIEYSHAFPTIGLVNGVASIAAEVGNGNGQLIFANGPTSNAVGPGTDLIVDWYGFISGAVITTPSTGGPLPLLNPNLAAGGGTAPYTVYSQGPQPLGVFAPVVGGHLEFMLGAPRDQLILPNSAQVGFWVVPEPSSFVLLGLGGALAVAMQRRVRRKAAE